ncbi:helix-turn-helix transcriptional regulator [Pedobacter sp. ISL-68]|uniref:helix-turn-helix transcriptional regulator n=1 Tax=unclassified Pedobacter TaxID=2628915 RepID=UPI001BEB4563|nr:MULTISPECIES: AraC family transcriptional regulator [unclassified Pedobacter]MBT2562016.1 helix-turn-helix transcriptional regulator [Pedobacter sp. ISL-64]MBT2591603.1 helix-turn-helix transcriptional regulator [Pedobacter sp. ISL-68]
MTIKLSNYPKGNIIYKNTYPDNFESINDIDEAFITLDDNDVKCQLKEMWFKGIHIGIIEIHPNQEANFCFESSQQHIGFLFCLSGAINYYHQQDNLLSLAKNEQDFNAGGVNSIKFNITEKTRCLYIQFTEDYFEQVTGGELGHDIKTDIQKSISPEIGLILQQIIYPKHEGRVKRLFLEARIFELIIAYFNQKQEKQTRVLKKEDIEKILLAKQLVEHDLQRPNSLMELSRKAGINDYKLKRGFKELTGHTVFGYLYKIRMEKAHYFLSKEKKTVNEVAFLVGYKNAQHFITAFKKQYSILPGSLNKS